MEVGKGLIMQEFKTKKLYGYMTCVTLMFVMISTHPSQTNATINESPKADIEKFKAKGKDSGQTGVQTKRIYFVDNQPVTVDTSKKGWAVDLLIRDQ